MKNNSLHRIVTTGLLCAIAFAVMLLSHMLPPVIPVLPFLKYDAKDVIIAIGGFIYGPLTSVVISVIVSVIEMVTVSSTGPIGLLMNVLASVAFAGTASLIYSKKRTIKGAALGLACAILFTSAIMLLWNYFITPLYTGQTVTSLLLPYILPFNLFKATVNAALTLALYKPVVTALRKAKLVPTGEHKMNKKQSLTAYLTALALIVIAVLLILKVNNII